MYNPLNLSLRFRSSKISFLISWLLIISVLSTNVLCKIGPKKLSHDFYTLELKMPNVLPQKNDEYFCTATNVTSDELYITRFDPNADSTRIHHIIIFGCADMYSKQHLYPGYWSCAQSMLCPGMKIVYAWGRNAPSLTLPKDVGFHIGLRSEVKYLVLQAHYAKPLTEKDSSGVNLLYTLNPLPNVAGIFIIASSRGIIPPNKPKSHLDMNCLLDREPMNVFAYRVHAHALGSVITGYRYQPVAKQFSLIAKGNPQWPQAFYPMQEEMQIARNDIIVGRCTYNSTDKDTLTRIGSTSGDEMCNLYLMFYSPNRLFMGANSGLMMGSPYRQESQESCADVQFPELTPQLPSGNDTPLPRNVTLEESAVGQNSIHHQHGGAAHDSHALHQHHPQMSVNPNAPLKLVQNKEWPFGSKMFGQVTASDVDEADNLVIFHRGKHVWNQLSFDMANNYRLIDQGPIPDQTIVTLNPRSQKIVDQWGSGLFYLPHGLTIDKQNKSMWLTDVALHQVFKFSIDPSSKNYRKAVITLGERFVPGNDMKHFCKPTSVAVDHSNGDFYVADGYCNSRVIRFDANGKFTNHWGHPPAYNDGPGGAPAPNMFNIPHKIVLIDSPTGDPAGQLACVADRENGRIQCFSLPYGYFKFQIHLDEFNGRLFSIAYDQANRILYAVAGPSLWDNTRDVLGFAFNIDTQQLKAVFAPNSGSFSQPHDVAVSGSGDAIYVVEIGPNNIWMFNRADLPPSYSNDGQYSASSKNIQASASNPVASAESSGNPSPASIIQSAVEVKTGDANSVAKANPDPANIDIKFNFELLRIRSRQLRNSISFNSILFFTLFALFLFIILLHYRYSSPHYSLVSFGSNLCRACFSRSSSHRPVYNSSLAERIDLAHLFESNTRRNRKFEKKGFNRLPQNETEVVDQVDEDEDDLSDVIEDFSPKGSTSKTRLV